MLDKKEAQLNSMSVEDKYDYSRKLIKQATSYKNSDIEKAINLIKKAIDICPEKVLSDYFKLSNYYFIAEQKEKSYSIHKDLLDSFNERDLGMFNMNKSQIYEKLCSLSYTDKQYENYLQNYCLWLYNSVIAFASQGRKVELENILKAENKLNFLSPSKVKGSFKKMKIETRMEIFNDKLVVYFERISEILTEMVNIAYTVTYSEDPEDYALEESFGERNNRLLKIENKFMKYFDLMNSNQFNDYFFQELKPILSSKT